MADNFTPINTQEEFDTAIGDRLRRERDKYKDYLSPEDEARKYKDYMSPEEVSEKYKDYMSPEEVSEKYKDYMSPEDIAKKYEGYLSPEEAAEKDKKLKSYESDSVKTRIALEMGIPYELAGKLSGETEDEVRADAKILAGFVGNRKGAPGKSTEPKITGTTDKKAAYRELLNNMKGDE